MTWVDLTFSFNSLLTATKMTQLDDNFEALAAGDSGAPLIQNAAMGTDSVKQTQIARSEGSGSVVCTGTNDNVLSLSGGEWAWWTGSGTNGGMVFGNGATSDGQMGLYNMSSGNRTFYYDSSYPTASPPHNLGDGDIELFITLMINNADGSIHGIEVAEEPTWAHHGATRTMPTRTEAAGGLNRKWITVPVVILNRTTEVELRAIKWHRPELFKRVLKGEFEIVYKEFEIDHERKNRDMDLTPHFQHMNDFQSKGLSITPIMLNPFSPIMARLKQMCKHGSYGHVKQLFEDQEFNINNEAMSIASPQALTVVDFTWKDTG